MQTMPEAVYRARIEWMPIKIKIFSVITASHI